MRRFLAAVALTLFAIPALATDHGQWANVDPSIRQWYETRTLTPAAQARLGYRSCCAHADVVKTRFRVSGSGNDQWEWERNGTFERVPDDIIHWDQHAPSGEPVLFAVAGQPVCFFPGQSGI